VKGKFFSRSRRRSAPKDESRWQVMRRQIVILLALVAAVAAGYGVWLWGEDNGWGDPQKAFTNKMARAQQAVVERRLYDAIGLYQKVIQKYAKNKDVDYAYTQLASAYSETGQLDLAARTYDDLLKRNVATDLQGFTQLQVAEIYAQKGEVSRAEEYYQQVIDQHPNSDWASQALLGMARMHQNLRDYKKALPIYAQVIKKYPRGFLAAEAQAAIGECYEIQRDYKKALQAYQKVLDDYPSAVWDQAKQKIDALKERQKAEARDKKSKKLAAAKTKAAEKDADE